MEYFSRVRNLYILPGITLLLVFGGTLVFGTLAFTVFESDATRLSVTVLDAETGQPTPVRVHFVTSEGRAAPLPDAAIAVMYGRDDSAEGYGYQPDSSFYVDGSFQVALQPGIYILSLSKGNEYLRQTDTLTLRKGDDKSATYRLKRWIDMPERGWYSADDHIHVRRSPRLDPLLLDWIAAEDIHVGNFLWMGDFWRTYYAQYAFGKEGIYREGDYLLVSGQEEPRTPELGHTLGLGADKPVRFPDRYYLYDLVFDEIHAHGGLTGYAHQSATFHGYRGLTLDGLRGKVDVMELLQYCADGGPLIVENYYRMLDLGYKVTATAGSDFPWCGKSHKYGVDAEPGEEAQIGNVRFYTYLGDSFSYERWEESLGAGHTFVSSGPVVEFRVNGKLPGTMVDVPKGSTITITATAFGHEGQVPLERLEIIGHQETLEKVTASDPEQSKSRLAIEMEYIVEHGIWIAAKVEAARLQVAHTTPVYVTVDGGSFYNPVTAQEYLDRSEQYLQEIEHVISHPSHKIDHQAWRYKEELEVRIAETRRVIDSLRAAYY